MKTQLSLSAMAVTATCLLFQVVSASALPADVLFQEDFENPDVPSYSQGITPDIWVRAAQGFGSGDHGMTDKSGGDFAAPTGNEQAYAFRYSNSGITTKEKALGSPLVFGGGYEVSFDVVKDNSTGKTGYSVNLIAFGAGAVRNDCRSIPAGSTQLASAAGNAPADGSIATVTFTFIPNATTHAAEFGKDLGIRVIGGLSSAIVDNIKFRAIPGTSSGLNLVTTNPLDNSVNNLATSPVKAVFNKNISAGSGNITLRNLTDSIDTVMPVSDPRIAISGTGLDILPGPHLTWAKDYAVLIDSGAVVENPGGTPFAGISGPTVWNFTTAGGDPLFYSVSRLKSHITGAITLSAGEINTIKLNLDTVAGRFAESSASITALLDLVATYDTGTLTDRKGPLWVATTFPKRDVVTNDLRWTMFNVMQNIMDRIYTGQTVATHESLLNGFKFLSSSNFPGACAVPAPNTRTAALSASYLKTYGPPIIQDGPGTYARKPTGSYLAPGTIATVTVPVSMVGTGYKIRVGCHSWDFGAKPDIKRLDRVTRVYDITAASTKVANPLGGGIYIEVPWLANAGVVNVDITGAARSPYFSAKSFHTTSASQWDTIERSNPGPWADFQTDKFMMQVPKSWISSMTGAQAIQLMTDWDASMDAINDLMGYTAFNPAIGAAKYIRGKETMYPQVDLLIKNAVYAPGYPSVNTNYSPTGSYGGYATSHLVRGPQNAPDFEFHEQGHGYLFPKFAGETESAVNLLHVAVMNRKFGKSMDSAFRSSRGYTRTYMTLDTTAMAWMCVFNFSPREVPMDSGEKSYQLKGHAKFVDIAQIYGWDVLGKFWGIMADNDDNNIPYATDTDAMLLRLCQAVGKDIRPLFHFWGIYPQNPSALAAAIAAANPPIPADLAIRTRLLYYKSIVPANNAAFRTFANAWWGKQPSIGGYWEEREHSRQWDQAALFGVGDQQRAGITVNEEYIEACATQIQDRVQELVDLYFPGAISPNTMTFAIAPGAVNATTIGMTATTATAAIGPIGYYFENTTNTTNSGWITTPVWNQTGLTTGTPYSFRVKARDGLGTETLWSATLAATPATDGTPPSPSPMTFSTPPTALSGATITMTAASATDVNGVEYEFVCTAGGGHSSGWQDSPTYTDTLLNPSTEYTYQARARDKSPAQNATVFSATASATTPTPDTTSPLVLTLNPSDNETAAAVDSELIITFDEPIGPNTGFITLKNLSDTTETAIDINDNSQVNISGATLSINPTTNLIPVKNYAVRIDATALQDLSANPFAGINNDTTWNFTTAVVPYVWTKTTGGAQDWATNTNWLAGTAPTPVSGDTVDFSSANITANTTLTLGADRTAQLWKFGDATTASHDWIVSAGNSMILAGATPTIEVVNRAATLNNIVEGSAGLTKSGTGTLTLTGANTYSGGTAVTGGILSVNAGAAAAVAAGPLSLNDGGRLTLSSTNLSSSSQVSVGTGGGSISASGNNNFTTTGKLTGTGVLTHADPGGAGNRSLNFNATTNDFTGSIIINGGNALTFSVNSLTDSANSIAFTAASGTNNFTYGSGATTALTLGSRAFEINSAGALNSTILNNNTTQAITINPGLVATGAGAKTLTLNAVAGPVNVFGGSITNGTGGGTLALTKSGVGTWTLGGTNTYSGATQFSSQSQGTLIFRGAASASPNTTFRLNEGCTLGLRDDTAGTVTFGAPMQVNLASAQTSARASTTINVNQISTGSNSTMAIGKLNYNGITDLRAAGATVNATGANGYNLQIGSIDLSWGINGSQNLNPTSASIVVTGTVMQVNGRSATGAPAGNILSLGTGAQVFTLDGTSTGNLISGAIKNAADHDDLGNPNALPLGVTKSGTGDWTLGSAANTFTGGITLNSTTTSAGTLSYASAAGANPVTFLQTTGSATLSYVGATPRVMSGLITASALTTGTITLDASGATPADTISYSNPNSLTGVATGNTVRKLVLSGANTGSNVFNGAFTNNTGTSNAATLTKNGAGTWVLTGPNAHTGATTVSAGKLFINGDQTAASGAVSVSATLGGTGIIGGATTIAASGKLEFSISTPPGSHDKLELATGKALTFSGASTLTITSTGGASTGDYILLTAPGGIIGSVPAMPNLPPGWAATVTKENSNTDLVLHVTSTGAIGAPEIAVEQPAATDIPNSGSKSFGTVTTGSNTSLAFTIRNTGSAALNLTGSPLVAVSGTNASDFTVTAVPTTPVAISGGTTTFTVQFAPGAAGARNAVLTIANNDSDEGTFTINVSGTGQTPYNAWSGGAAFDADANGDGVKNGLAFLLGAANPNANALDKLPVVTQGGGLVLTFQCLNAASRGSATLNVQHSSDLGISDAWTPVVVPNTTPGAPSGGVTFTVSAASATLNNVTATISLTEAASGKLFGRLKATP